jgi:hypothetical protein
METKSIDRYPEPGVRCSEITLTVRITYESFFTAPGEWDHDRMLHELVGDSPLERHGIEDYNVNCTSHVEWVEINPITYSPGFDKSAVTTTPADEVNYRDHCRELNRTPSQAGFWRYVLKSRYGIRKLPPSNAPH